MRIDVLETPALLIDLDVMERNLRRAADYAKAHGLRLRPHTKTHKTPALAGRQLALGAVGLTVAKVGEAEVMAQADPPELLVAYPVLGESKLRRLAGVARSTRVMVALDSLAVARGLPRPSEVREQRRGRRSLLQALSPPKSVSLTYVCTNYQGCSAGHPTEWCAFDGGGHTPAPIDGRCRADG